MKVQTGLILIAAFVLLCSCSPTRFISKKEGCKEIASHIKNGWIRNDQNEIVDIKSYFDESRIDLFKEMTLNRNCILGLDKDVAIKVFGVPHLKVDNTYHYYLKEGCFSGINDDNCTTFYFRFDPKNNLLSDFGMKIPDHSSH